jgi:PAS domain S-box-containing protein
MVQPARKTGISLIGDVTWGTHFCQFYQTKEDLIEILVPYFKAGLESNEFCMWVTSEPLGVEDAKASLKKAVPGLDDYIQNGQIEILDATQWYTKSGKFDPDAVMRGWVRKENQALKRGFDGLRLTGNTFWLEKADWRDFAEYEQQVNKVIGKHRMIALCTYCLDRCGASEIVDVVQSHQFALIRRAGEWELIQSSERMLAEEALKAEKEFTETALNAQTDTFFVFEPLTGRAVRWNKAFSRISGYSDQEIRSMKAPDSYYSEEDLKKAAAATEKVLNEGIATVELSLITKDGRSIPTEYTGSVIKDDEGNPKYIIAVGRDVSDRKRAEEALGETNKLLQALLDHTHMMVAYLDPQFNFVKVNQAYAAADAREPSFFLGKNHFDLYPNAENQRIFRRVAESGEPYFAYARPFEYPEHPERGVTYWDWSLIPIKGPMGAVTGLVLTLVNVTERERAERALRESEERLRSFMDSATNAFVLWDKELNLVDFNEAALKTFAPGARKTEVIGKSILELVPTLKQTGRYERYLEVIRTARPFYVDEVILDPEFGERRVAVRAFKVGEGLGMVVADITERKLAEEALKKAYHELETRVQERTRELSATNIELREEIAERKQAEESLRASREDYRTLVETSRDMIFTVDLNGAFLFTNRAFEEILGYEPKEVRKINGFELVHPEDSESVGKQFARLVEGQGVDNMEYRYRRKDGSYISILNNASPIFDAEGKVVAAFGVARDITERKRAEQELTEYRDHLQELVEERTAELRKANEQLETEIVERKQAEEGLEWELAVNRELAELSEALIAASSSIPEVANVVLDSAKRLTRSEHGYVSSIDPRTGDNVGHTLTKMMGDQCLISAQHKTIFFPAGPDGRYPGLWGHALTTRRGFFTNSPAGHESSKGTPDGHIPLKNFLSVPAMIGEELVGQIALANSAKDFTDRHLEAIKRLAGMYALAVQRGSAQEALRESEERFRTSFDNANTGMCLVDLNGILTKVNGKMSEIFGYSRNELEGMSVNEIAHPDDLEVSPEFIHRSVSGEVEREQFEKRYFHKQGHLIWCLVSSSLVRDSKGDPLYFVSQVQDITERKLAEEALRESEEKFRSLAEQSPNMIFINKKDRVVYANERCEEIMGYKREEFYSPDFDFFVLIAPESRDLIKKNLSRHMMGQEVPPYEYTLRTKEGRSVEAIINSKLITYGGDSATLGIVTDIAERKRMEGELRKRTYDLNERVKELKCLYGIGRLIETPGMSLEGIFQGAVDLIPTATQYPEVTCARLVLEDRIFATSNFSETRWKLACDVTVHGDREGSLEVYYLEERSERDEGPFLAEEKNLLKTVVERLGRVIERKRAEEEIQKLNRSLEIQAAQLAAANKELEAFSYSVSHDLRAPLRTADGFSRALMEDYPDKLDERGKDYLRRIRAATQRMGQLVDDLLNLSMTMRKEMRREQIDLSEVAHSIAGELKKTQPERLVELVIKDGVLAHGDPSLLREVLENLLRNAWKFTGKQDQARIEFGETSEGVERVYFVRDDGVGFDMKYAERLFVPFQRLHSIDEFPGNGVGLALVSRIIDRHGGRVWAEGEVEKGATFYFTLP